MTAPSSPEPTSATSDSPGPTTSTTDGGDAGTGQQDEPIKAIPVRHPGRWVASAVLLVLVAMLVNTLFFSQVKRGPLLESRFQWDVVGQYLFSTPVLKGLVITIELTAIAMTAGIILGVVLAIMRLSTNFLLSSTSWVYIWFFRGTPVYVQLFFWYVGLSYLYPKLGIGIPFGPEFVHLNANTLVTPLLAAIIGLSFNEGAYMAEIVRAGILSVDSGQVEAAQSIGMRRVQALRLVILPQAMRIIIPPTGNEVISMLKTSSLASAITVAELFYAVQAIYARTYQTVPLLLVACIWYLILTSILTVGQYFLERRYSRGAARPRTPRILAFLWHNLFVLRRPGTSPSPAPRAGPLPSGNGTT